MPNVSTNETFRRWLRFNFVGLIGVGVQLAVLTALVRLAHVNYLAATFIAVEAAVIHNFLWHERFTWRDRPALAMPQRFLRFLRFNIANGMVSIAGNLGLMYVLVGRLQMPFIAANVISIAACALINFFLSDRVVFTIAQGKEDNV